MRQQLSQKEIEKITIPEQKYRLLLDSGSQRSYIARCLADIIDAKSIRTEYLANRGFGALTSEHLPKEVVDKTISDKKDKESVQIEPAVVEWMLEIMCQKP